jgi:acyl carrier protein phosphodiesterase
MNFLAHLYLSEDNVESRLGNFLGDFWRGDVRQNLPPGMRAGVDLHHRIDSFTDTHPQVRISRARMDKRFRHLTGVMVDVFYDHYLAKHWGRFSEQTLEGFIREVYTTFRDYPGVLPHPAPLVIERMAEQDWLLSYQTVEGISLTLRRMSRRMRRPNLLYEGGQELADHYEELQQDFDVFFPELVEHVRQNNGAGK